MIKYEFALTRLLKDEGFYSNHKKDLGGETWRGIARRFHPDWEGWAIVDAEENKKKLRKNNELQNLVHDFYYKNFWGNLSKLRELEIIADVFSAEVLCGKRQGVMLLQKAYNLLNSSRKITVDGLLGPITASAVNTYNHPDSLLKAFKGEWYIYIKERNNPAFIRGWLNRIFE